MRSHVPSSRTPAVHTVSPYFRESVGYVLTVMRTRCLAMRFRRLTDSKMRRSELLPRLAIERFGHAVAVTLLRQMLITGERHAGSGVEPFADLREHGALLR